MRLEWETIQQRSRYHDPSLLPLVHSNHFVHWSIYGQLPKYDQLDIDFDSVSLLCIHWKHS